VDRLQYATLTRDNASQIDSLEVRGFFPAYRRKPHDSANVFASA
jgi:hypothetical protein